MNSLIKILLLVDRVVALVLRGLVVVYQKTLSPDHGLGRKFYPKIGCKFYPSCSEYMRQSLLKFGFVKGFFLGLQRLGRCHPFSSGGVDPVPEV